MKKITLLIATLALALPVAAQQKEPAKPAAQEAPKAEAPKPAPMAEAPKPMAKKHTPSRRTEDARPCLDKGGSNTEIIKCAEEYL